MIQELESALDRSHEGDHAATFNAIVRHAWFMIQRGVKDRHDPLHTPVLATVDDVGADPRIVVLRGCDVEQRQLWCHTDLRSPKIGEVQRDPRISWLLYHPKDRIQLRLRGMATIHADDAIADRAWESSTLLGRRCYCGLAPSMIMSEPSHGLHPELLDREPTEHESMVGRANFAVLRSVVNELDWLYLRFGGHYRAQFRWDAAGNYQAQWVTP